MQTFVRNKWGETAGASHRPRGTGSQKICPDSFNLRFGGNCVSKSSNASGSRSATKYSSGGAYSPLTPFRYPGISSLQRKKKTSAPSGRPIEYGTRWRRQSRSFCRSRGFPQSATQDNRVPPSFPTNSPAGVSRNPSAGIPPRRKSGPLDLL